MPLLKLIKVTSFFILEISLGYLQWASDKFPQSLPISAIISAHIFKIVSNLGQFLMQIVLQLSFSIMPPQVEAERVTYRGFCPITREFSVKCGGTSKMAASCCGVKKQKLNNSLPSICCNGSSVHPNYHKHTYTVAIPDMCFFCFDVLHSHLFNYDLGKAAPRFTNDP